jgi:hypothetical protein
MLFKVALALLIVWLLGVGGPFDAGPIVNILLLVGLMLLLLAVARSLSSTAGRGADPRPDK